MCGDGDDQYNDLYDRCNVASEQLINVDHFCLPHAAHARPRQWLCQLDLYFESVEIFINIFWRTRQIVGRNGWCLAGRWIWSVVILNRKACRFCTRARRPAMVVFITSSSSSGDLIFLVTILTLLYRLVGRSTTDAYECALPGKQTGTGGDDDDRMPGRAVSVFTAYNWRWCRSGQWW